MQRRTDTQKSYSVTTSLELGKFFPDKANVTIPVYYSYTKEITSPKYNPLDTDMKLDDALESAANKHERDSIEDIAVTRNISSNFSVSNARVGIKNKKHPMPYDPANFSISYSHAHRKKTGNTIIWDTEDQWRGSLNYTYSPVYKTWEPFKKLKGKSKWLNFPKALGLNYLPQSITFGSELNRTYSELQERDLENTVNPNLPLQFNEQFLFNRDFTIRWDLTKNLHMTFQSATHAEIEEPYTPVNKDLYPDRYSAWKDSIWTSIAHLGRPLDYNQSFNASYQLPIDKLPVFDWLKTDASYNATYSWLRGTELDNGTSLGNSIANNSNLTINGSINMETLYNHIPFLKKTNERFKKQPAKKQTKKPAKKTANAKNAKDVKDKELAKKNDEKEKKELPKNKNSYQREVTLLPDTTVTIKHGKKSKRLIVTAKTKDGKSINVKYKVVDDNTILLKPAGDSIAVKLSVMTKQPLDQQWWYSPAQYTARLLMMVRNVNLSYRKQHSMSIPGFLPNVADAFGQNVSGPMAPGLDFAFGLAGDSYIQKALDNGWLLCADSVASPSTSSMTEDLQIKATLEPVRDLKIDLTASRTMTRSKSVQFMYEGSPTTQNGSFNMTTISIKSAFEGMGDASNGYHSPSFDEFRQRIGEFHQRVSAQYAGARPGITNSDGTAPNVNAVNPYSADVLIPAFLSTYTSGNSKSLSLFPALSRMLPNWTIRYSGLSKLEWVSEYFKSVNINHGYKSMFSIGAYNSYSSWLEYMGDLGFVKSADGSYSPSSMYNISTVSINEAFSPLLGIDMTLHNNMTFKVEYKTTRVLNLSMTSVQINEALSKDWVIGMGYKISNFNLFSSGSSNRKVKGSKGNRNGQDENNSKSKQTTKRSGINHDLNTRVDVSFRNQAAITRDIASGASSASSGNSALKISLSAEYTLSRYLSMTAYYERQTNTPLLSANSYPTTTQDFGVSLKFSLTR